MPVRIEVEVELIVRLIAGDQIAFRAIYDQLHKRIYRLLLALVKDREQTEELLQETFVSLWLNREKLNATQSLYPYVYLTARRLAIDHFRKKITEMNAKQYLAHHQQGHNSDTEDRVNMADLQRFTAEAIKALPKQQQTVFILSRNEGLSHDEIAERLQISRHTVKNHLVSALRTLKVHFVRNNITSLYFLVILIN